MIAGHLNTEELEFVNISLLNNRGMSDLEYSMFEQKHPYIVIERDNNTILKTSKKYYGNHDTELNKFILNKFGNDECEIDFFYTLTYDEKDYTAPHRDAYFVEQTTLLLLSDTFTGGRLIINDEDVNFSNAGQYISFNGHTEIHGVTPVESGQRIVLVIMFNKKKSLL